MDEGREQIQHDPHITVTVIAGGGHHPQLTHPRDVAQTLTEHTASSGSKGVS